MGKLSREGRLFGEFPAVGGCENTLELAKIRKFWRLRFCSEAAAYPNCGVPDVGAAPARRNLKFHSLDDVLSDLQRLEEAERAGKLKTTGQWTPGEILSHLAAWIEYGYEGYPLGKPPFFLRWILKRMLPGMLRNGMRAGVRIPGAKAGTYGQEKIGTSEAFRRYRAALARFKQNEPCPFDSPAFGPMSMEDRVRLNLRHAELHLSFLQIS